MSLRHYIDGEVPGFGELDAVVQAGGSTIVQAAAAAWPERGGVGMRVTTDGSNAAYMTKTLGESVAAGGDLYIGFWQRINAEAASGRHNPLGLRDTADSTWAALLYNKVARDLIFYARADGGANENVTLNDLITIGRWHYIVVRVHRASSAVAADGYVSLYLDGELRGTTATVDNFDIMATPAELNVGARYYYADGYEVDIDEIKIATTYPEPYVPTPDDYYVSAERTCVLYRSASSDSTEFADYCVTELAIPRANLIPLPDATANETLADYATFQSEVEDGIAAYFALNPTVATNCMCFLVGYGVPGYFTDSGLKHSATSRLAKYGVAFSSGSSNQLYVPGGATARLTLNTLRFVGQHLATRIDAPSLAEAKTLIDRAATVSALDALPDADKLYADDAAYLASLPCQKLRIITAALAELDDAALVWDDNGAAFGTGGSRAIFHNDQADSAELLRSGAARCYVALFASTFAAAFGSADTAETFDATRFFEMLRIGGTFAEAALVATSKLNYTAVAAGSPLMTVAVQLGGYNIYWGEGGAEDVDFDTPLGCMRADQSALTIGQSLDRLRTHVFVARAISPEGQEEHNTHVLAHVKLDEQGQLTPVPLARVNDLTVEAVSNDLLLIAFSHVAPAGFAVADGFDLVSDGGTGQLDLESPVGAIDEVVAGQTEFEITLSRPVWPLRLAVRTRNGADLGPLSEVVLVGAPDPPAASQLL